MPDLAKGTRAALLDRAGGLAYGKGDYEAAYRSFAQSVALRRQTGHGASLAQALIYLEVFVHRGHNGDATRARALYEEALEQAPAADAVALIAAALIHWGL